jgi:ubiquinone/menaquinone biosynthesis C-methylase UbiE
MELMTEMNTADAIDRSVSQTTSGQGTVYSDADIVSVIRRLAKASDHPDQVVYSKSFFDLSGFDTDGGRWFLGYMKQVMAAGQYQGKELLEMGCGFGWDAATMVMMGARAVTATDILPSMIDGLTESFANMARGGVKLNVKGMVADACKLPFADNSFDGAYSMEAIEHVHDLDLMFDEVKRVLRPGGRFVIVNDSNALNTDFREATFKMWVERDESHEHAEGLKKVRPVEHANAEPYAVMRERIVRQANSKLTDTDVSEIVKATAGLTRLEIEPLAKTYGVTTVLPQRPTFKWCRNPETGEYAERLLNPFELAEMMRKRGFKASVGHGFQRFPHRLLNNVQFEPLNRFLYDKRPQFMVVAQKQA